MLEDALVSFPRKQKRRVSKALMLDGVGGPREAEAKKNRKVCCAVIIMDSNSTTFSCPCQGV